MEPFTNDLVPGRAPAVADPYHWTCPTSGTVSSVKRDSPSQNQWFVRAGPSTPSRAARGCPSAPRPAPWVRPTCAAGPGGRVRTYRSASRPARRRGVLRGRLLAAITGRPAGSTGPGVPGSQDNASMTGQWEPVPFAHRATVSFSTRSIALRSPILARTTVAARDSPGSRRAPHGRATSAGGGVRLRDRRRLLTLPLDRRAEPGSVHGGDHLLHRDLRRVVNHARLLVAEAHVRPRHALEPFQGPLDRQGSRPSRHALDREHDRRGRGRRRMDEQEQQYDRQPRNHSTSHRVSFMPMPFMSWPPSRP